MKNKAFTLTELLIALAVIGVLISILLPVISNVMPDQNALMAKRAYHGIQSITSSLINDEACYPNKTYALEDARIGFDDGYGYSDCPLWGGGGYRDSSNNTKTDAYIDSEDANSKFLTLFTNKLDIKTTDTDILVILGGATTYQFTTKDKMVWTAQNMKLAHTNSDPSIELMVDVNGPDKPNCKSASDEGCSNKKDFDRFTVKIHADGKLDILEEWALDAVGVDADITGSNK